MNKLTSVFLLFLIPLPLWSLSPAQADSLVSRFKQAVLTETAALSQEINELAAQDTTSMSLEEKQKKESFIAQLKEEKTQAAYGKLSQILTELPRPEPGADRAAHYRSVIEGVTDQLVINRIVTNTQSFLMPMVSADGTSGYRESNIVLLNEIQAFIGKLDGVKTDFLNKAVQTVIDSEE